MLKNLTKLLIVNEKFFCEQTGILEGLGLRKTNRILKQKRTWMHYLITIKNIKKMEVNNTCKFCCFFVLLIISYSSSAQETEPKRTSIRTGIGLGFNHGKQETGTGFVSSIGWQKSFGEQIRFRFNPNLIVGGFFPFGITDTRDQYYRLTSLGLNLHYDLIRYKSISIVTTVGSFLNYSRGLLGTGGWPEANNNSSVYFHSLYFGGTISAGIRIAPKKSTFAYELRPINVQLGNDYFEFIYFMFGIDIKLQK
mgnify:CR=1 FL=1